MVQSVMRPTLISAQVMVLVRTKTRKVYFFFNVFNLFLGQRETEHERGRGGERGRHRIGSRLQAPSGQHRPYVGLKPTKGEIMT